MNNYHSNYSETLLDKISNQVITTHRSSTPNISVNLDSIREHLQNLLNTRKYIFSWSEQLTQLQQSMVDYGLDDFMSFSVAMEQPLETYQQLLATTIMRYEPRFTNVEVKLDAASRSYSKGILELTIFGTIVNPQQVEETVVLHSLIEPHSGTVTI